MSKVTGMYTVNMSAYGSDIDKYEVHADGGYYLTTDTDTAAAAKRVAKNVWNNGMSKSDAEHLEYYGEDE